MIYVILAAYLIFTLVVGLIGHKLASNTVDDYFLAGRAVGPIVLFFTLIATNFSAFFFLGFAGAGYRIGYSYYPIMAFGTALVGIAFYFIGYRAWRLGKQHGYVTPPELIGHLTGSRTLRLVFLSVMVLFTVPYLSLQPIGAGYLLEQLTGGRIPYFAGATLLTISMVFYVFLGGMRGVAATDVLQGVLMFVLMALAVILLAGEFGGITAANDVVRHTHPELFTRRGGGGFFTPGIWFSYMVLWILAVPMFPQVFMRFFIPRTSQSLKVAAALYPVVCATIFIAPILIGVIGRIPFPDLAGTESDQILPMLLAQFVPEWLAGLIMVGALAAFMSTMDSQLLALSSMLTRDAYVELLKRDADVKRQVRVGKLLVVLLAAVGLALALQPPDTIFAIATEAFTGLAVLFPTTIAVLYWRRVHPGSCVASIVIGQILVIAYHYDWVPDEAAFGLLPVVPIVAVCAVMIVVGSLVAVPRTS